MVIARNMVAYAGLAHMIEACLEPGFGSFAEHTVGTTMIARMIAEVFIIMALPLLSACI